MCIRLVAVFFGVLSFTLTAHSDGIDEEARVQFAQGVEFYEAGKYEKAAIAFERAYELKPSYRILYNIGQVENELEHYAAALGAYSRYLKEGGDEVGPDRRAQVEKEIERLRSLVGTLRIESLSEGAVVQIDGVNRGTLPLSAPIVVDMGKHEVRILDGTEELYREVIKIAGGQVMELDVRSGIESERAPVAGEPIGDEAKQEEKPRRVWTWISLGIGGAALASGGIVGGVSVKKRADLSDECVDGSCPPEFNDEIQEGQRLSVAADVLYTVGAVGLAAGVTLFFLEPRIYDNNDKSHEVVLLPTATGRSAGFVLTGRF